MRSEGYKPCTKCGETKPLTEFSPDRRKLDGRQSSCKACGARVAHAWRKRNPEKQRQQGRRKFAKKQRERPGAHAAKTARWRAENPEHYALLSRAHLAVAYALKRGMLQRPDACEECGASGPIEAHHDDHSRLLEVRWLCRICHRAADKARQAA